jgi:hypothetical protein
MGKLNETFSQRLFATHLKIAGGIRCIFRIGFFLLLKAKREILPRFVASA